MKSIAEVKLMPQWFNLQQQINELISRNWLKLLFIILNFQSFFLGSIYRSFNFGKLSYSLIFSTSVYQFINQAYLFKRLIYSWLLIQTGKLNEFHFNFNSSLNLIQCLESELIGGINWNWEFISCRFDLFTFSLIPH